MTTRRWPRHHRLRVLGIICLILGSVHAPWPQADFHNVRHHDRPGELCEHHDHLLRWHPDAGRAADVAILHWHWVVPDRSPLADDHAGPGPILHAHVDGWDLASIESAPRALPDPASRPLEPAPPRPLSRFDLARFVPPDPGSGRAPAVGRDRAVARLAPLLQRWTC